MSLVSVPRRSFPNWMQSNLKTTQRELGITGMHQEGMPLICFAEDKGKEVWSQTNKTSYQQTHLDQSGPQRASSTKAKGFIMGLSLQTPYKEESGSSTNKLEMHTAKFRSTCALTFPSKHGYWVFALEANIHFYPAKTATTNGGNLHSVTRTLPLERSGPRLKQPGRESETDSAKERVFQMGLRPEALCPLNQSSQKLTQVYAKAQLCQCPSGGQDMRILLV